MINPEGLRSPTNSCVTRRSTPSATSALIGAPILGCYSPIAAATSLNVLALEALLADTDAWSYVDTPVTRRESGHAELSAGVAAATFGPDVS